MFGWLKRWKAARAKRAEWEIEMGMERSVAMARAIDARNQRLKQAQAEAEKVRQAAWTHSREQARTDEAARIAGARAAALKMQAARAAPHASTAPVRADASPAAPDLATQLAMSQHSWTSAPVEASAACSASASDSSDSSSSSGSDGGGGCGGGD